MVGDVERQMEAAGLEYEQCPTLFLCNSFPDFSLLSAAKTLHIVADTQYLHLPLSLTADFHPHNSVETAPHKVTMTFLWPNTMVFSPLCPHPFRPHSDV